MSHPKNGVFRLSCIVSYAGRYELLSKSILIGFAYGVNSPETFIEISLSPKCPKLYGFLFFFPKKRVLKSTFRSKSDIAFELEISLMLEIKTSKTVPS